MSGPRTFDEFKSAVLKSVAEAVEKTSSTPPLHFVMESPTGTLKFHGPIPIPTEQALDRAPDVMRGWVRRYRPPRVAVVTVAYTMGRPLSEIGRRPRIDDSGAVQIVTIWFFRRGSTETERWLARVIVGQNDRLSLGAWEALTDTTSVENTAMWNAVAETMSERNEERDSAPQRPH